MMKSQVKQDEEWQVLFKKAIVAMCKNGLCFKENISIEGVLAITLDHKDVVVVNVNENVNGNNTSRYLPTVADDLERKKMLAPMLSKLFGSGDSQSQVLVSGLSPDVETVGRLVLLNDGSSDRPQAKLVLNATSLLKTGAESVRTPEPKSQKNAEERTSMDTSPSSQIESEINTSLSPPPAHQNVSPQTMQSSKKPMDLTLKKSLDTVIAKLHKSTSPSQTGAETTKNESTVTTPPPSTQIPTKTEEKNEPSATKSQVLKVDKRKRGSVDLNDENVKGDSTSLEKAETSAVSGPSSTKRPRTSEAKRPSAFTALRRFASRKTLSRVDVVDITESSSQEFVKSKPKASVPVVAPKSMQPQAVSKQGAKQLEAARQSPRARILIEKAKAKMLSEGPAQTVPEKAQIEPSHGGDISRRRGSADSTSVRSEASSETKAGQQRKTSKISTAGFSVGMKLEAEDKGNELVCCASIADIRAGKLRIHFDGWEDGYDFWCYPWSKLIHPVGWCQDNEVPLSPPKDWEDVDSFTWEDYIELTRTHPAPMSAFKNAIAKHEKSLAKERAAAKAEAESKSAKNVKKKVIGTKLAGNQKPDQKSASKVVKRSGPAGTVAKQLEQSKDADDMGRRVVKYCGKCGPCRLQEDCGKCTFCLEKPKIGGHNTRRQKCEMRKCEVYKNTNTAVHHQAVTKIC